VFAKLQTASISFVISVCLSLRLSAWSNSAHTEPILVKFDRCGFIENLSTNSGLINICQEWRIFYMKIYVYLWQYLA